MNYRFFTAVDLPQIYETFKAAFVDYYVEMTLSPDQFAHHLADNGVDYAVSVGAFQEGTCVGVLLQGIDTWQDILTAYDAGTGVVPDYRGQGIAGGMLAYALPALKARGVEQCLLEVIQVNEVAIRAYQKLGFRQTRVLHCIVCDADDFQTHPVTLRRDLSISPIEQPDWASLTQFWDWHPAWQNGGGAMKRLSARVPTTFKILGAFAGGQCLGYAVFLPESGRIAQIAVDKAYRRQGIGGRLLQAVAIQTAANQALSMINIDAADEATLAFFAAHGFKETVQQYEMTRAVE